MKKVRRETQRLKYKTKKQIYGNGWVGITVCTASEILLYVPLFPL